MITQNSVKSVNGEKKKGGSRSIVSGEAIIAAPLKSASPSSLMDIVLHPIFFFFSRSGCHDNDRVISARSSDLRGSGNPLWLTVGHGARSLGLSVGLPGRSCQNAERTDGTTWVSFSHTYLTSKKN